MVQTIEQLETALTALNAQRSVIGDEIVDLMIVPLQQQLQAMRQPATDPMGERKLVTIVFADISGFTAMSEALDPEQVRRTMNDCFDAIVPCIKRYGGTVDKFIGDAVMALFGAPIAQENHAESAARASLEMLNAIHQFNKAQATSLGIHIGINTGLVVAGGIGSQGQQQYSVMGDAVNLAARLEDASDSGEILIGAATYRLIAPLFDVETRSPITLKGKSEPVPNYRLIAATATPGALRGLPGPRSHLVGRSHEQLRLQGAIAALREGAGRGARFAILGDAGIGKSRLIAEFRQTNCATVVWTEGRALSYNMQTSFFLARQLLLGFIGLHGNAKLDEIDEALRASVTAHLDGENASTVYLMLARLLNIPAALVAPSFEGVTPQGVRSQMLNAFRAYVRIRARNNPLVMVWEDLHWADPSSLALLDMLMTLTDEVPLLIILALREDESEALNVVNAAIARYGEGLDVLRLAPLSPLDSAKLVENLLKVDLVPDAILQLILEKAEGNAFFIEEIIQSLIDAGMIIFDSGHTTITTLIGTQRAVDIPHTLQGVVAARIDRLPAIDKQTLQMAAVIGRLFERPVLSHLYKLEIASGNPLDALLLRLLEHGFIHQGDQFAYIFKHAVTHEVAYSTLLIEHRKRLHRVTAEAMGILFPQNQGELAPTLAYHYKNADMPDEAIPHLLFAAERAKITYANTEAISFYRTALEQIERVNLSTRKPRLDLLVATYENLGSLLGLTGQREEARSMFQLGLDVLGDHEPITRARLNRLMANTWVLNRHKGEAEHYLNAAQKALGEESLDNQTEWWHEFIDIGLERLWFMYWLFQEEHVMLELVVRLEPSVTRHGTPTQRSKYYRSRALYELSRCGWYHPDERAVQFADQAVLAAKQGATMFDLCFAMFGSAFVHLWRDEFDTALAQFLSMLPLAEKCGDAERLVLGVNYIALTYRRLHRVEETQTFAERTLTLAAAANMPTYVGMAKGNLAWVYLQRGEFLLAETTARAGLSLLAPPIPVSWATTLPLVAALHRRGEIAETADLLEKTLTGMQRLAPSVEAAIKAVISNKNAQDPTSNHACVADVLTVAQQHNYL